MTIDAGRAGELLQELQGLQKQHSELGTRVVRAEEQHRQATEAAAKARTELEQLLGGRKVEEAEQVLTELLAELETTVTEVRKLLAEVTTALEGKGLVA